MSGEKERILNSEDKELSRSHNALAFIFRKYLVLFKIDGRRYNELLNTYLRRCSPNADPVSLASDKGNLNKALLNERISWKTFMRGIDLLGALKIRIRVDIQMQNGKWYEASTEELTLRKPTTPVIHSPNNSYQESEE